jgi:uroporphyrinogen-III decarboxylase
MDVLTPAMQKFNERLQRVENAIALKESDKLPVVPFFDGVMQRLNGSSYKDNFYDHRKAADAVIKFFEKYSSCDAAIWVGATSGKANELAGTTIIDWPGRPGSIVSDYSTHQVLEREFMTPEEYPELLKDFSGFMQRKFIPRVFANLKGLSNVTYNPSVVLSTGYFLGPLYSPEALEAYKILGEIAKADAEAAAATAECNKKLAEMGFPPFFSGISEAPFDILGDYFRGTVGMMMDLFEYEDEIAAVCDMFAEQQIAALQYFKFVPMPVKRVFFPLHKGMDGFLSPKHYERLYWKPLKKIINALIDMGVTPFIYTEGKYNTRLEQLTDVPRGKVIYHFEEVDMKEAKRILGNIACITGNLPIASLEFGKKEQVVDYCKYLIDTCAPGGGYIFDFNGSLENAKPENLDAMFETLETYK